MSPNNSSTGRTPADNMVGGCEFESHLLVKLIKIRLISKLLLIIIEATVATTGTSLKN